MSDQVLVLSLNVLLWLFLAYRFIVALRRNKNADRTFLYAWGIFIAIYLIAALTVDSIELAIDSRFGGLPAALLIRTLLMFATAHVFYLAIRKTHQWWSRLKWFFLRFSVLMAGLCTLFFVWATSTRLLSVEEITHILKGMRDITMIGWLLIILIPTGIYMLRHEQTRPTKLRSLITMSFYTAFLLQCVSGIAWSLSVFYQNPAAAAIYRVERLSTYVCYLLFLAMLIPYRWLMPIFYPQRLRLYFRLRHIGSTLAQYAKQPIQPDLRLNITHPNDIELAIYNQVIAILDMYQTIPGSNALRAKIADIVEKHQEYNDLVQHLASVRA